MAKIKSHKDIVTQTFEKRCYKCHGKVKSNGEKIIKGHLDLVDLMASESPEKYDKLRASFDLILANKMPPEDSKPLGTLKKPLLDAIAFYTAYSKPEEILAKEKYNRRGLGELTIKLEELLGVNLSFKNPLNKIPDSLKKDRSLEDNQIDDYFLEQYISSVGEIVDKAFYLTENKQEPVDWNFDPPIFIHQKEYKGQARHNGVAENIIWYGSQNTQNNGIKSLPKTHKEGMPYSGYYDIEITAKAMNRGKLPDEVTMLNSKEPLRLGLLTGLSRKGGKLNKPHWYHEADETYLSEFDVPDNEFKTFKTRVWLEKYYYPRFVYMNGAVQNRVLDRVAKHLGGEEKGYKVPIFFLHHLFAQKLQLPYIHVNNVKIKGVPFVKNKYLDLFGEGYDNPENSFSKLKSFAEKAFEQKLSENDFKLTYDKLVTYARSESLSQKETLKYGVKYILSSARFLYKNKAATTEQFCNNLTKKLTQNSSQSTLFEQPLDQDSLMQKATLGFAKNFIDHWLHLYKSETIFPNIKDKYYKIYFRNRIKQQAMHETYLTFLYMLRNNKSALDLLDSDYKVINTPMARHYKLEGAEIEELTGISDDEAKLYPGDLSSVKFQLYKKEGLGGLLGHASVMNLTSDEVGTNPILRGVWVMKDFLGIPMMEPPADIPAFEPDLRYAKTVKQQIELHKTSKVCASCHVDIDPLGLALESFDNIGQFRERYRRKKPVENTVELFGETVTNLREYNSLLVEKKQDIFVMTLSQNLLEFFLERSITDKEYFELYERVSKLKESSYPMHGVMQQIFEHSSVQPNSKNYWLSAK